MAVNGMMYTAQVKGVTVTNAAQNLFEMIAGASVSFVRHSVRLEFIPIIISGVAQDFRANIAFQTITTTGTGGTAVVPIAEHPRNSVGATTTVNMLVTTPGTLGVVKSAENPSIVVPFERLFTPDQRIPISGGGRLAIALTIPLGSAYLLSGEIYFEEM